jgi:hypothetical protein
VNREWRWGGAVKGFDAATIPDAFVRWQHARSPPGSFLHFSPRVGLDVHFEIDPRRPHVSQLHLVLDSFNPRSPIGTRSLKERLGPQLKPAGEPACEDAVLKGRPNSKLSYSQEVL